MAELPARNAQGFRRVRVLRDIPGLDMANGRPWKTVLVDTTIALWAGRAGNWNEATSRRKGMGHLCKPSGLRSNAVDQARPASAKGTYTPIWKEFVVQKCSFHLKIHAASPFPISISRLRAPLLSFFHLSTASKSPCLPSKSPFLRSKSPFLPSTPPTYPRIFPIFLDFPIFCSHPRSPFFRFRRSLTKRSWCGSWAAPWWRSCWWRRCSWWWRWRNWWDGATPSDHLFRWDFP